MNNQSVNYNQYLRKHGLQNFLSLIEDLSNTKKLEILQELRKDYSANIINRALYQYKKNYIDTNRVFVLRLKNILKNTCKRLKEGLND